jgi:DNA polymerase III alpha subunit
MQMPALAMTDHGNLFGAYDFYQAGHRRRHQADHRHGRGI